MSENLNELGYPVLNDALHAKLFYGKSRPTISQNQVKQTAKLLKEFKISLPVDRPNHLYNGDLPFPPLTGSDLSEHFESLAKDTIGTYIANADRFASLSSLPALPPPESIAFESGWVKYTLDDKGEWKTAKVDYPDESVFVFDTETFVTKGGFPVIGTAVGSKAVWVWLSEEMVDPNLPESQWTGPSLIPLGHNSFIIGHNVSYDRARSSVDYNLNTEITNFWWDTMAAHIAVSGLASDQRWLHVLNKKDPKLLTERERKQIKYKPAWFKEGSTNSLVEVYNFHVANDPASEWGLKDCDDDKNNHSSFQESDKKIRDAFVQAIDIQQLARRKDLITYALKDSYYTAVLFQRLWPKYKQSTPSMVGMASQYYLNASKIPLSSGFLEWVQNTEKLYEEYNERASVILKGLVKKYVGRWQKHLEDDLKRLRPKLEKLLTKHKIGTKTKAGKKVPEGRLINSLIKKGETGWMVKSSKCFENDEWLSQLDWTPKSFYGKFAKLPTWASGYMSSDKLLTTKTPCAGLLLKLSWEGSAVRYTRDTGYCFTHSSGMVMKIPHPKGNDENVGNLLSKDFVTDMEVGRLSSGLPEAEDALQIANATSYWTSVRKRVLDRIVRPVGDGASLTLPQIVSHGTVTRRTVEPLMATMCSTKAHRIGTELKSRVECPQGWKVVGADFDQQELQVASIYADCWESTDHSDSKKTAKPYIGASPLSFTVLAGSKAKGTDAHTALATEMGVSRDVAKIVNFAILYGGGAKTISSYVKKVYKDMSAKQLQLSSMKAIDFKKGRKNRSGIYFGGSDSGCYNTMEKICSGRMKIGKSKANGIPTLPVLGTKISSALRPSVVGRDFITSRTNWTIQSAGSEILCIYLVAIHWLAKHFGVPMQFIISIHDEVWFMVPESLGYRFATLMQMAHLLTWARFHQGCNLIDVPLARAYFSDVAVDNRLRKTTDECTKTPSNPQGSNEPEGISLTIQQLCDQGHIKSLNNLS